jgi:ribosomal protein L11 methyltransferase
VIRLAVRVARADAELVLAELLELVPAGVEEVDRGDVVEYAIYGAPGEVPELPALRAAVGRALVDITTTELADDWSERWRSFHKAVTIGERLHVRPPWAQAPAPSRGLLDIAIDPAQAFGTGAHDTTRLCLEALLELAGEGDGGALLEIAGEGAEARHGLSRPCAAGAQGGLAGPGASGALLDLGCGSGVLAIAAAKLGWQPVLGLDHERESVEATRENAAVNDVVVEARLYDLLRDEPPPSAPVVVANLLRPLLLHVARKGFAGEPPRVLVASGLLAHEADEVAAAFADRGLHERERRHGGEWAALTLARE